MRTVAPQHLILSLSKDRGVARFMLRQAEHEDIVLAWHPPLTRERILTRQKLEQVVAKLADGCFDDGLYGGGEFCPFVLAQ